MKSRLRDLVLNRFREREFNITPEVLADFFVQCRRRRPDYLFGYSSMLYEFALYVNQNGLSGRELKLRAAICSGEKIHDHFREAIHEAFGCPTVSEYGATEVGIIAHECPEGRHHISEDSVHLEILDKASQPVPDGEMGRVVVTVLHSQASPIIRYELNDFATLSTEPCPCGVTLRCLKSIEGRTSEVVIAPDGRVFHGMIFYYIMKDFTERMGTIKQFRLHQRALDRLDFYIVPAGDFGSDAEAYLKQRVREKFGDAMQIKLIYCDEIEREKSGKLRHFETDLDTSEHLARLYSAAD
jgi:phenylacetate-CoA ligase